MEEDKKEIINNDDLFIDVEKTKRIEEEKKEAIVNSKKKKSKKNKSHVGLIIFLSIIISFIFGMLGAFLISQTISVEQVVKNVTTSELVENSISSSVDKVYNSTVMVSAFNDGKAISTGTGFIYKKAKNITYIITNNHVIDGANEVKVEFNDSEKKYDVEIIGGEKYADIAVLALKEEVEAPAVEIGETESLKLGDTIFTVGTPMGEMYKGTVTKGILSGKNRMVDVTTNGSNVTDYYMNVLQIDAAVNPGNSGGPLCDVAGKVIGVISLKIVEDRVEGMGFAIPIEDALKYAELIEKGGTIHRPYIGVSISNLTDEYYLWQNRINIPDGVDDGVAVITVENGSPAAKAGLKKGDIIVKIGDKDAKTVADFKYQLYKYEVGDKVTVSCYREGKIQETTIVLGKSQS